MGLGFRVYIGFRALEKRSRGALGVQGPTASLFSPPVGVGVLTAV